MNTKEVNAMTDDELRVEAAELDGYTEISDLGNGSLVGSLLSGRSDEDIAKYGKSMSRHDTPNHLNDMAAAWGLVEANPDWRWAVYGLDDGGWCASPMKVVVMRNGYNIWDCVSEATDETAQRAITKAFIMAMEAND